MTVPRTPRRSAGPDGAWGDGEFTDRASERLRDRRYAAGPVLRRGQAQQASVATLREVALPHPRRLVDAVGETAHVVVPAGSDVRFVGTVERDQVLRVGDVPAGYWPRSSAQVARRPWRWATTSSWPPSGGPLDDGTVAKRERELRAIRRRGFAVNDQATEPGVTAVRVAVLAAGGVTGVALWLAVPTVRYCRDRLPVWSAALAQAGAAIASSLGDD